MIEDIFKKSRVDFDKLIKYGFEKEKNYYIYSKNFMNDAFKAVIKIYENEAIKSKVIDMETNDEYLNINVYEYNGSFVNEIRDKYKNILIDIRDNCFINKSFLFDNTNSVIEYIDHKYNIKPEFLWDNLPDCCVFRNKKNKKWFAIIMCIDKSKISDNSGYIELINVKTNNLSNLLEKNGYYKAYHMNKKSWVTISLDEVDIKQVCKDVDDSYDIVDKNKFKN